MELHLQHSPREGQGTLVTIPVGTLGLLLAHGGLRDTSTGNVRCTQDELESLASSQSCRIPGVDGTWWDEPHSWNAGMEGAGGQVAERVGDPALTVSDDDGGEPLDEDQAMENKGGAAVGYPWRALCRLKRITTHWAEYSLLSPAAVTIAA